MGLAVKHNQSTKIKIITGLLVFLMMTSCQKMLKSDAEKSEITYTKKDGLLYVNNKLANGIIDKLMYKNGYLFSGDYNGIIYQDGIVANKVIYGRLYQDGVLFTGIKKDVQLINGDFGEQVYENGILFTGTKNNIYYRDGVVAEKEETVTKTKNLKNGKIKGLFYKDDKVFTGILKIKYKSGHLKESVSFKNGKENGKYSSFYKNGRKRIMCFYKNGKKHGKYFFWYSNGKRKRRCVYKNGRRKRCY